MFALTGLCCLLLLRKDEVSEQKPTSFQKVLAGEGGSEPGGVTVLMALRKVEMQMFCSHGDGSHGFPGWVLVYLFQNMFMLASWPAVLPGPLALFLESLTHVDSTVRVRKLPQQVLLLCLWKLSHVVVSRCLGLFIM